MPGTVFIKMFYNICFFPLITDLQGVQRWSFHINTAVNTCLDHPLLCEIPCRRKSGDISSIIYNISKPNEK